MTPSRNRRADRPRTESAAGEDDDDVERAIERRDRSCKRLQPFHGPAAADEVPIRMNIGTGDQLRPAHQADGPQVGEVEDVFLDADVLISARNRSAELIGRPTKDCSASPGA